MILQALKSAGSFSTQLIQFTPPFIDGDTDEEEDVVKRDDRRAPDQKTVFPTHYIAGQALKENFYSLLAVPLKWLCAVDRSAYRTICVAA